MSRLAPCALAALFGCALPAAAQPVDEAAAEEAAPAGTHTVALRTSLKGTLLLSRAPADPQVPADRDQALSFWRLRLEPQARLGARVTVGAAYEHRLRVFSASAAGPDTGLLPAEGPAPYRIRQLDWRAASAQGGSWRHEIDRAYLALHLPGVELTLGRQAVGWGRGVLFSAVDLFAPFTPLEVDREWRRGVDAVRADVKVGDRASLDVVGAFGQSLDASAIAGRLRGYAGKADLELAGGRRGRDIFAGMAASAAAGQAEVHCELALFRAPAALPGTGGRRSAVKAVAGASYRFPVADGLLVYGEYHYSGFGARRPGDVAALLADPSFRERYLRGDTQILGRHALAAIGSLEVSPELALGVQWLQSPTDGSGLVAPSVTVTFGDAASLLAIGHVPFGRAPRAGVPASDYGAAPRSVLLQVRLYR